MRQAVKLFDRGVDLAFSQFGGKQFAGFHFHVLRLLLEAFAFLFRVEFLEPVVRQEDFTVYSDQDIKIGQDWHQDIQAHLDGAKAVVLLITKAFLASDYIANSELL